MAEQDPITNRAEREDTLAGLLGGAWLSWSNVPSPSVLKLDDLKDIFRSNEIVDQTSALWNDAYAKTLAVTQAKQEELAALLFLLFFDDWVDDLSTRWNARVEKFSADQKSDSPKLPPWEYVRGKGGLLVPRSAMPATVTTTKPVEDEEDDDDEEDPSEEEIEDSDAISDSTIADRKRSGDRNRKRQRKPQAKYSKPLVTPSDFKAESIALIVNGYTDGQLTAAERSALQGAGGIDLIWMCEPGHCDDCGQFCGRGRAMWSRFTEGPQLHRWCRCWLKAVKIFSE